jgi:hypothetical protein
MRRFGVRPADGVGHSTQQLAHVGGRGGVSADDVTANRERRGGDELTTHMCEQEVFAREDCPLAAARRPIAGRSQYVLRRMRADAVGSIMAQP